MRRLFAHNDKPSASPTRWLALALCGLLLAGVCLTSPNFGRHTNDLGTPIAGDFLQEWIGAYSLRTQGSHSLFELDRLKQLQHDEQLLGFRWDRKKFYAMVYPPFYYALWVPFTWMEYRIAAWIFVVAMVAAHLLALRLLQSAGRPVAATSRQVGDIGVSGATAPDRWSLDRFWPALCVLFTIFSPVIRSISTGQKGTLCLLILVGSFCCLQSGRRLSAGLVFGLIAFKPHLGLVIGGVMLVRKQWQFVCGALLTVSGYVAICLAMGTDVCAEYIRFCLGAGNYVNLLEGQMHKSHCLYGFLVLAFGGTSNWIKLAWFASAALVGWLLFRLHRQNHCSKPLLEDGPRLATEFAALVLATVLLAPHLFTYDLTMLLLPMALVLRSLEQGYFQHDSRRLVVCLLVGIYVTAGFSLNWALATGLQLSTLLMLGLLALLAFPKLKLESWLVGLGRGMNRQAERDGLTTDALQRPA